VNSQWLLPDDGIIDPVAVEVAAAGTRRVRLTVSERRLAAALILTRGGTVNDIAARLHVSGQTARRMAGAIRAADVMAGVA
jgi:DNA-binding NarL/FixJ family response regulator